jgi:class 3 adenylate cyclase
MSKIHPVAESETDLHMPLPSGDQSIDFSPASKPFIFRKLFGINSQSSDLTEYASTGTMHSRRMASSSNLDLAIHNDPFGKLRRKSTAQGFTIAPSTSHLLTTTDENDGTLLEESEDIELSLLNQVSATLQELKRLDDTAWKELTALTSRIYSRISHQDSHEELRSVIIEHGFTTKYGWRPNDVDVNGLLQAFSNIYIAMQNKHTVSHDAHIKIKNIQALTFCPNVLFANFPHEFKPEPCSISFQSAVLLADISGFSKFAGEMCLQGARGLDVLHKVTSDFLGHFVHTVYDFDGDGKFGVRLTVCGVLMAFCCTVIAFAGDALICIFPATTDGNGSSISNNPFESELVVRRTIEEACLQALRCAYGLREHKMHSLSAHFAISCGPIQFALLGGLNDDWTFLMNGACIGELTNCIDNAPPQNVVCTKQVIDYALDVQPTIKALYQKKGCTFLIDHVEMAVEVDHDAVMEIDERLFHANSAKSRPDRLNICSQSKLGHTASFVSLDEGELLNMLVRKATHFIPHPVLNAMQAETMASVAELRHITTMFLNLDSYSPTENVDPLTLQPFFLLLQEILSKSGGFLRQFLIDDKGCVAIAMWGVPSYTHNNDCSRGLFCAWNMNSRVAELNHRCSIGLTTGHAYCGIVGSNFRRDYACIGDKVNIAARLMAKAGGRVLVDPDVVAALDPEERACLVKYKEYHLKGMAHPMTPYTFGDEEVNLSVLRTKDEEGGTNTVLRKDVIKEILSVLDKIVTSTPFLSRLAVNNPNYHNSDLKSAILVGEEDALNTEGVMNEPSSPLSPNALTNELSTHSLNGSGTGIEFMMRSSKRSRRISVRPVGVMNNVIVLLGMSGTGKSTAAQYFKQSALRRKLRTAFVQCRMEDETTPYSIVRKMFWEVAGRKKYDTDEKKRKLVENLMNQAVSDSFVEFDSPVEERIVAMNEILVDGIKRGGHSNVSNFNDHAVKQLPTKVDGANKMELLSARASASARYSDAVLAEMNFQAHEEPTPEFLWANPEETAACIVALMKVLLSNHPSYYAVVVEEGHYCDECSWFLLLQIQRNKMKIVMLLTVQSATVSISGDSGKHASTHNHHLSGGKARRHSLGSAEQELAVTIKTARANMSTKGQLFQQCQSFKSIMDNKEYTTVIEMKELNLTEVNQVLKVVTGRADLDKKVVSNVLEITSGNAFWVKAIAKFIKEFGEADFEKQKDGGTTSDALKNLIIIRMEKLTSEQQLVVKYASVLGQEFTVRTLAAVLPDTVVPHLSQSLAALIEMGFIFCLEEAPLAIYGFHNMLTRDTIYDILPPRYF